MATETTNYKLIKPEQTDYYNVDVFNDNADIVDTALAGKANTTHTHTKNQITDFPTSLKNPTALTINLNGTTQLTYDGSAAKTVTVTPSSIGAAASSHTHDNKDFSGFDVGAVLVGAVDTTIAEIYPGTSNDYLGSAGGLAAFVTPDTTPTMGSNKLITSGGVYNAIKDVSTSLGKIVFGTITLTNLSQESKVFDIVTNGKFEAGSILLASSDKFVSLMYPGASSFTITITDNTGDTKTYVNNDDNTQMVTTYFDIEGIHITALTDKFIRCGYFNMIISYISDSAICVHSI